MPNKVVGLFKRVRTSTGWRCCPVIFFSNGRIKPDYVIVDGKEEHHPEGAYYLNWYEGKRQKRISVGKDPVTAVARQMSKQAELNARNHGVAIVPEQGRTPLATAISDFLEEIRLAKKPKTHIAYSKSLEYFRESCSKQYLDEVDRQDMLRFNT